MHSAAGRRFVDRLTPEARFDSEDPGTAGDGVKRLGEDSFSSLAASMSSPDWLHEGGTLRDPEDEQWRILSIGVRWVELGHPDRGKHRLLREDLIAWVEEGRWRTLQS